MQARLFRTTAIRLALKYAAAYAIVLALVLATFSYVTQHYAGGKSEEQLLELAADMQKAYQRDGQAGVVSALLMLTQRDEAVERARLDEADSDEEDGDEDDQQEGSDELVRVYYLVLDSDQRIVAGNILRVPEDADDSIKPGEVDSIWIDEEYLPSGHFDDDAYLPTTLVAFDDGSRLWLALGVKQLEELHEFTEYLVEILGAALVLSLIMSISLGRNILRRIETISAGAGEIMQGDMALRMPLSGRNDEFDALSQRLNEMLERIQKLIRGLSEVTDNIAHDLRSPLTRIRNRLEVTMLESRPEDEYRNAMQQSIEDADGLIKTFNSLLGIAQAEAGNRRSAWSRVEICSLAADLGDLYEALAQENDQRFELSADCQAWVLGSRHLIAQAIGNLVENAIKFTPAGGTVGLTVKAEQKQVKVRVSDTGPGIPRQDWERVQERFVRLDGSRHLPGNGLGLSMVRAVCRLHGVELCMGDNNPGLIVTLVFKRDTNGDTQSAQDD